MITKNNIQEKLEELAENITEQTGLRAFVRRSNANVPHIVIVTDNQSLSICYFLKYHNYQLYTNYGAYHVKQEKFRFTDEDEMIQFIEKTFVNKEDTGIQPVEHRVLTEPTKKKKGGFRFQGFVMKLLRNGGRIA